MKKVLEKRAERIELIRHFVCKIVKNIINYIYNIRYFIIYNYITYVI